MTWWQWILLIVAGMALFETCLQICGRIALSRRMDEIEREAWEKKEDKTMMDHG